MFVRSMIHNRRLFTFLPVYLAPDKGDGDGGAGDGDAGAGDGDGDGKTFTQAQVDALMGKTRGAAASTTKRELLEALGVKDETEAKKLLAAAKAADEKNKTELERAQTKAAEHETAAQAYRREATQVKLQLKIDRQLLKAKADPNRLERLSKSVYVDLEDDADDDAITAAIEAVKTDFPEAFTADDETGSDGKKKTGPAPSGNAQGGKGPKTGGTTESALDRGKARARLLQGKEPATNNA